mmetsp:Transcript_18036/g.39388  ORF Transcript_18036/g.39388 Transcript_18036/m.39388 type:complete len:271 (+) Transcript_18036:2147-2959(+)
MCSPHIRCRPPSAPRGFPFSCRFSRLSLCRSASLSTRHTSGPARVWERSSSLRETLQASAAPINMEPSLSSPFQGMYRCVMRMLVFSACASDCAPTLPKLFHDMFSSAMALIWRSSPSSLESSSTPPSPMRLLARCSVLRRLLPSSAMASEHIPWSSTRHSFSISVSSCGQQLRCLTLRSSAMTVVPAEPMGFMLRSSRRMERFMASPFTRWVTASLPTPLSFRHSCVMYWLYGSAAASARVPFVLSSRWLMLARDFCSSLRTVLEGVTS